MATAQLDVDSNKFNLPVVKASAGPDGIVVSKLRTIVKLWVKTHY